jgi:hypothetical protein
LISRRGVAAFIAEATGRAAKRYWAVRLGLVCHGPAVLPPRLGRQDA